MNKGGYSRPSGHDPAPFPSKVLGRAGAGFLTHGGCEAAIVTVAGLCRYRTGLALFDPIGWGTPAGDIQLLVLYHNRGLGQGGSSCKVLVDRWLFDHGLEGEEYPLRYHGLPAHLHWVGGDDEDDELEFIAFLQLSGRAIYDAT